MSEVARIAGPVACLGLATLFVARPPRARLAALAAWAAGSAALLAYLAPADNRIAVLAAAAAAVVPAAGLAALFLRWPWLFVAAVLVCVPVRIPVTVGGTEANLLLPLYGIVAAGALAIAWQLVRGDDRSRELGAAAWPLAALVTWTGVSLLWADDLREGAIALGAFYLPFGVAALFVARLPWSRRAAGLVTAQLVAMAALFAAIGVYQWVTRDIFWNPKVIVGNAYAPFYRVNSVFWDPSIYGRFLVVAIIVGVVLLLHSRRLQRLHLALAGAVAAIWIGLLFSFSQSSFAALIVGVVAAAAFAWRWRAAMAVGLAGVALLLVGVAAPNVRSASLDRATSGRSGLVSGGVRIAADNPVGGVGVGGFKRAYAEREGLRGKDPKRAASHNTPITVAAETGLPGLALLAWLFVGAVIAPLRHAPRTPEGRAALASGIVIGAIAVHSLFYSAFFEDPIVWGTIALGALATAAVRREREGAAA